MNLFFRFTTSSRIQVKKRSNLVSLILVLFIASCSGLNQTLDPTVYYPRDMGLEINGQFHLGATVVPEQSKYDILFEPRGNLDMLIVRSCHQEKVFEPEAGLIFGFIPVAGNKVRYTWVPRDIERDRVCPLRGDAYDSKKGKHSWFLILPENKSRTVGFTALCNGEVAHHLGTGLCQSRFGLYQVLEFDEPVRFAPPMPDNCELPVDRGNDRFEIRLAPEECLYTGENEAGESFLFLTIGYQGVLIRSDK